MSSVDHDLPYLAEKYDEVSNLQFENGVLLVDRLSLRKGCTVLDVGCGTGRLAIYASGIVGPTGHILAIDPSPHRIAVAKKKLEKNHISNVQFNVAGSDDLKDLKSDSFCNAYLAAVFHWIEDKESTLNELFRVIMPGGKIGITTGDKDNSFAIDRITKSILSGDKYIGRVDPGGDASKPTTRKELEYLLKAAGFRDIEISVKKKKRYYQTPTQAIEFTESSAFGNFLRHVPEDLRAEARRDIEEELERRRTPGGIELESVSVFAIATKSLDAAIPKYFEKAGPDNTQWALRLAKHSAVKRGIKHVVVASSSGDTGVQAAELLKDTGISLIVVSLNTGIKAEGVQPFDAEARARIEALGGKIHTGTLVFSGLDKEFTERNGYTNTRAIADTLRMFGQGTKVLVEITAMAADAGLIPPSDVIAVAGTGKGADTAAIIKAASSNRLFDIRIKEYIAKPGNF